MFLEEVQLLEKNMIYLKFFKYMVYIHIFWLLFLMYFFLLITNEMLTNDRWVQLICSIPFLFPFSVETFFPSLCSAVLSLFPS